MKKLKIQLDVTPENRLEAYLELINGILKLTPTQLRVLVILIQENPEACTPAVRHIVTEKMKFKNVAVTNNFIKVLKDKGIITKNERNGVFEYTSTVIPPPDFESVEFTFKG
jgi:Fe2+ or Zn2+ uptake regulation protein